MKNLLIAAGYDINSSLENLNASKIQEMEEFLDGNELIGKLECCYSTEYKAMIKFRFLPGHKAIILAIPNMLRSKKSSVLTDQELKSDLIKKLMSSMGMYARKVGISMPNDMLSESNICDFHRPNEKDFVCQCRFSCPFCHKSFQLEYKTFWRSSNAWKHLKCHLDSNAN